MSKVNVWHSANLFIGDADPTDSNHLTLKQLQIPSLDQGSFEHTPGGGVGSLQVVNGYLAPLALSFQLAGVDPKRLSQFGFGSDSVKRFTIYAAIKDALTGSLNEGKIIVEGIIQSIGMSDFTRGGESMSSYAVSNVIHYEQYFNSQQVYYLNLLTNDFSVNGVSQTAKQNQILRIPSVA